MDFSLQQRGLNCAKAVKLKFNIVLIYLILAKLMFCLL